MVMKRNKRPAFNLGCVVLTSLLALQGCADALDGADYESEALPQQLADGGVGGDASRPTSSSVGGLDAGTSSSEPRWAQRQDLGKGDGKDVILIGDSWMSLIGEGLQVAMKQINRGYRAYGVPGTKMLDGFGPIPTQFDQAVRADKNIKTIVMTGGGNDVLIGGPADCSRAGPNCKRKLIEIRDGLVKLWEKAAAAGVQDVMYIGYSEGAGSTPAEITNATKNGVGDACLAMKSLNCHLIDSTPIIGRRLKADGIHPQQVAHRDLAQAVYKLMEQRKVRR